MLKWFTFRVAFIDSNRLSNQDSLSSVFTPSMRYIAISSWLIGTLYAVTDEVHQHFVPDRACRLTDILIDSFGVLLGIWIFRKLRRKG